ncbi:MAG TPA: ATP-binding protein [Roseomonas sp.]|jgi:anti-sigma regulatory factor (Ser/Thr protein kinase)
MLRLLCGRDMAEVEQALDAIEAHLLAAGAAMPDAMQLRLVAEEIVTNIARCAWPEGEAHQFTVELATEARPGGLHARLTTIDDGMAFDPTDQAPPDLSATLEDRQIGGLGMFLVQEMTDAQHYAREEGRNRFSVERLMPGAA